MKADLTDQLSEDLAAIARDAEEIFQGKGEGLAARAQEIRQRLADALERTDATIDSLNESSPTALENVEKFIKTHPFQAVGIAAGAGLLLALLVKRK